jgi:hypothetical protein
MRLTNYIMLWVAIVIVFFFLGYPPNIISVISSSYTSGGVLDIKSVLTSLFNSITTDAGLAALGISALAALALTFLSGFGAIYIIPIFIIIVVFNIFTFPISTIITATTPDIVKIPLLLFFNVLLLLTAITFIRGGD